MKMFTENNRLKLCEQMKNASMAVFFSGSAPAKLGDESYSFTPNRNFYYLTGLDQQNMILTITKNESADDSYTTLYIQRPNDLKARWIGENISSAECSSISGIAEVKFIDEFEDDTANILFAENINTVYLDLESRNFHTCSPAVMLADKIKKQYPHTAVLNIRHIMSAMRSIKSSIEIENIKKAIAITKDGLYNMMKNSRVGMYEYQLEACFDFELKMQGVKDKAFATIAASGINGTTLHYSANSAKTQENDLLLCDAGAQFNYYNADITRTFPVNGKFTKQQKLYYDIVLEGQLTVIDAIKPGIEFAVLNEILKKYYCRKLKSAGLIKDSAELSEYYFHSVSHMLGLETHDVGRENGTVLAPGMVLTVEPGLYIRELSIGIRIEDDVLVTDNGCTVLSKDIVKTTDEIESLMHKT